MIQLTPAERELRSALIANAKRPPPHDPHPKEYWLAFADDAVSLGRMAYHVNQYETERGRPELSYFGTADDAQAKIVFNAVRDFWHSLDVELMDALDRQFDVVNADLAKIKQMLRTLLHGGDE